MCVPAELTVVFYKNSWKLICVKTSHIASNMTVGSNALLQWLSFYSVIFLWRCTKCRPKRARYEIGMLGWQDMPYISIIRILRARILAPLSPIIDCVVWADRPWCRSSPRSTQHQPPPLILTLTHTNSHISSYGNAWAHISVLDHLFIFNKVCCAAAQLFTLSHSPSYT